MQTTSPDKSNQKQNRSSAEGQTAQPLPQLGLHPAQIVQRMRMNPASLNPRDIQILQRSMGNRAVGRLLAEVGLHPSPKGIAPEPSSASPNHTNADAVIQRRPIDGGVYSDFDPKIETAQTKNLLDIAKKEDEIQGMANQAASLLGTLQSLKTDEMVGDKATAQEAAIDALVKGVAADLKNANVSVSVALKLYETTVGKKLYEYKPTGTRIGDVKAKAAAREAQVSAFVPLFDTMVQNVNTYYASSKDKSGQVSTTVTALQKESAAKHKAKKSYTDNTAFITQNRDAITSRATKLGVAVPPRLDEGVTEASDAAATGDWLKANEKSQNVVAALKSTDTQSTAQQKKLDKAQADYLTNDSLIQPQKKALFQATNAPELTNLLDTLTTDQMDKIRRLLSDASASAGNEEWFDALRYSKDCLAELATLDTQIRKLQEFPNLLKKTFTIGAAPLPLFSLYAVVKLLRTDFPTDSASAIETKLRAYCTAIGVHSTSEQLLEAAIRQRKSIADLNALTGEIALKEHLNKGKSIAQANLVQEANTRFHNLDYANLTWLVQNNQVNIGFGNVFLMANTTYINAAHREYLLTGADGVKARPGTRPAIHVHWNNVNGTFPKAHVIPDLDNRPQGANPVQNDIPDTVNPVKQAIVAAGCTP